LKNISWRWVLILAVVIAAVVYVAPTFKADLWPNTKINLGLDLQGGMHLALQVETDKAVDSTIERFLQEIRSLSRRERIRLSAVDLTDKQKIRVQVNGTDNVAQFQKLLDDEFAELRIFDREESMTGDSLEMVLDLPDEEAERIQKLATSQALETIRNRIDQFGVSEPDIRRQGENRILIQLPGISDTERAKELIGRTALLEFKLVDNTVDPQEAEASGPPPGTEILYEIRNDPSTNREVKIPYVVEERTRLTGAYLTDARVQIDSQYNEPYVSITFDQKGARLFERITAENVKERLAIVLDDNIYSAPVIQERISGGEARITGNFTTEEARDLAIVLRAGALPAPVTIIEERTVGPSLGSDSIHKGLISMLVGGLLVVVFMVFYYRGSGLIADTALLLNIVLIAGGLAGFGATLTLPGIAGIILTIGMAVDANVLIFERIREEQRLGKTSRAAVDAGFSRATLTILDANVTTLIAALVLFQFGTGPVKGFAVTLSLGVVSSLFTALIVSRAIFDFLLFKRKVKSLSI